MIVALVALSGAVGHAFVRLAGAIPGSRDDRVLPILRRFIGSANVAAYLVRTQLSHGSRSTTSVGCHESRACHGISEPPSKYSVGTKLVGRGF